MSVTKFKLKLQIYMSLQMTQIYTKPYKKCINMYQHDTDEFKVEHLSISDQIWIYCYLLIRQSLRVLETANRMCPVILTTKGHL